MMDETKFEVADPNGVFLTLTEREARAMLADLNSDDDLSDNLKALRDQLAEWVEPDDA